MKQQPINVIPYILALIAILYLAFPHVLEFYEAYKRPWNTHEDMTNADVQKELDYYHTNPNEWDMMSKYDPNKPTIVPVKAPQVEQLKMKQPDNQLRGPKVPPLADPSKDPKAINSENNKYAGHDYPELQGPQALAKDKEFDPTQYDYVPAAEFPQGPASPSPYLNDFSKILNA